MIATVEMPQGSILKYEIDKITGCLIVDRMLNQPVPYNYGCFLENTLCGDGDPLDVFILGNVPIYPLTRVKVELLGVLRCQDNGESDDKLIAMIEGDNTGSEFMGTDIIRTYLTSYKSGFIVLGWGDALEALEVYKESCRLYEKTYNFRAHKEHV